MQTFLDRFEAKIDESGVGGCWLWTGSRTSAGYGLITINGKVHLTHRVSWYVHRGAVPPGICVCHRCDVPACVNPDHLFLGSHVENIRDAAKKGRMAKGERSGRAKLTEIDVMKIRRWLGTIPQPAIAEHFGVTKQAISAIAIGRTWRQK